jgi:cytoskeleton protein RodZ
MRSPMKTVGKQLQEARLAKNWTPELAARETKIKVDRLRDLEGDDYSHFTSPTYARGFVRTYARALGLDEYRILRQLDNKLPDDDSANIVTDTGVAYLPETSMPPRAAHRDYTGLYIVMGLGVVVSLAIAFVLFEAYRVGELSRYFGSSDTSVAGNATNSAPEIAATDTPLRAKPIDSNTPPPIVEATPTNAPADAAPTDAALANAPRAQPVDLSAVSAGDTNAASPDAPIKSVRALPVDPSELANPSSATVDPATTKTPPRALPVDPADLTNAAPAQVVAMNNVAPVVHPAPQPAAVSAPDPTQANMGEKRLVLTASHDSFVRVTSLDAAQGDKPLYASVLHSGQSVGINVGVPAAVDIKLDGVNYGPHSDQEAPETFTVQSHQP